MVPVFSAPLVVDFVVLVDVLGVGVVLVLGAGVVLFLGAGVVLVLGAGVVLFVPEVVPPGVVGITLATVPGIRTPSVGTPGPITLTARTRIKSAVLLRLTT